MQRISVTERFGPYRKPTEETIPKYKAIGDKVLELALLIEELCPEAPEKYSALTDLMKAKMQANAAIAIYTKEQG
jgi:hypothetical protein